MGFFAKLKAGLDKTRKNILRGVDGVLGAFTKIDEDLFEELEEALIMADMGVQTTMDIVENLRKRVKREHATDPAAVVYDAVHEARKQNTDLLICDTAGRLHNKKNLMEELKKIARVIEREYPAAHREVYLVLDATTGQNALQQAKLFQEVTDITGIVLTKLDGTAKGGIVVAIKSELQIPVRYIGVGEGIHDLQKFDAAEFAGALFGREA